MSSGAGRKSQNLWLNQAADLQFYYSLSVYKSYRKHVTESESFHFDPKTAGAGGRRVRGEKAEISVDQMVEVSALWSLFSKEVSKLFYLLKETFQMS